MAQTFMSFTPSPGIRALLIPGGALVLLIGLATPIWLWLVFSAWAGLVAAPAFLALAGVGAGGIVTGLIVGPMGRPSLIVDETGIEVPAYSIGPLPWREILEVAVIDSGGGGLRVTPRRPETLPLVARCQMALNGGLGVIVISHSYLNAPAETVMEAAQSFRAEGRP